jgi:3-hydroxyisobutyrate dehydrogenase
LRHAAKEAALAADAAHTHHVDLPLTGALLHRWQRAIALGHGADDVASAVTVAAATNIPHAAHGQHQRAATVSTNGRRR